MILSFLGHSSDWMTVEWSKWGLNERIRSCLYKRQHLILSFLGHSSDWMTVEWSKWGPNERIGCCLYKRQHLILSFLGHSSVIQTSFYGQSRAKFLFEIPGWWLDDGMMAEWQTSQNSFFFSLSENPSIPPHSVIPYHFWMTKNENYNGKIAFNSHSGHFHFIPSFDNDVGMTEWGQMKGVFLSKAKPLILKTL